MMGQIHMSQIMRNQMLQQQMAAYNNPAMMMTPQVHLLQHISPYAQVSSPQCACSLLTPSSPQQGMMMYSPYSGGYAYMPDYDVYDSYGNVEQNAQAGGWDTFRQYQNSRHHGYSNEPHHHNDNQRFRRGRENHYSGYEYKAAENMTEEGAAMFLNLLHQLV